VKIVNGTEQGKTLAEAFKNQEYAFLCFFNHPTQADIVSQGCQAGATLWPLIFTIGYIGMFGINALMIKKYGVLFPNIVGSNVQLLSMIVFAIPAIVTTAHYDKFSVWPLVGCVIIIFGILVKGTPQDETKIVVDTSKHIQDETTPLKQPNQTA